MSALDTPPLSPPRYSPSLPPAVCPHPVRRAVMVQRWVDAVFLHWPYDPVTVQALLPPGVEVDTFDGQAWVGLVPFHMEGLGLPGLAPLPLVGAFPEVNVRTYVRAGGRRAVWFFSLDVDRRLPAAVARLAYRLPYHLARAAHVRAGDVVTTQVQRRWPGGGATSEVAVGIGEPAGDDEHTRFLTARWGLVSCGRSGRLRHAAVDHAPWTLHRAEVLHLDDQLVAAAGLPVPTGTPMALWSAGVDVRVGRPTPLRTVP